jgi:hypothetical protein
MCDGVLLLVVNLLIVFLTSLGCKLISTISQKLFGTKEAAITCGHQPQTHYSKCLLWWSYIKIKMTIFGAHMDSETLFSNSTAPLGYGSHKLKITAINSNPGHMEMEQYDKNLRFKKINAQDINFEHVTSTHSHTTIYN